MDPFVTRYADCVNQKRKEGKVHLHLADPEDPTGKWIKIGYHVLRSKASSEAEGSLRLSTGGIGEDVGSDMLVIVLKGGVDLDGLVETLFNILPFLVKYECPDLPEDLSDANLQRNV